LKVDVGSRREKCKGDVEVEKVRRAAKGGEWEGKWEGKCEREVTKECQMGKWNGKRERN
jgi:hypothetical protein